jgi:hypothetical protein
MAANANRPSGARLVGTLSGSDINVRTRQYTALSTNAIFPGDFVKLGDAGTVDVAAAGDVLLGVCIGIVPNYSDLSKRYKPASTAGTLLVCDDPNAVYEIQEDSVGNTMATTNIGSNGDIVATAGSTTTGQSQMQLDSSDVVAKDGTPASAQLRVVGIVPRDDNVAGNDYGKWLVVINEHAFSYTNVAGL